MGVKCRRNHRPNDMRCERDPCKRIKEKGASLALGIRLSQALHGNAKGQDEVLTVLNNSYPCPCPGYVSEPEHLHGSESA